MHIRTLRKEKSAPHNEAHPMSITYGCQGSVDLSGIESGGVDGAIEGDTSLFARPRLS